VRALADSNELQKAWLNLLEAPKGVVEAGLKDFNNKLDNLLAGEGVLTLVLFLGGVAHRSEWSALAVCLQHSFGPHVYASCSLCHICATTCPC
jgi:hypothetical protein